MRAVTENPQDRRLQRGAQSRRTIVRHGVDLASAEGLDGLSFGRLAADLGVSKSGIQTLFGTKEALQLAVAEAAREAFTDAVVKPGNGLRPLVDRWLHYAEEPLFTGGCFWAANLPIFDGRPGIVRDTLAGHRRAWRRLLATELRASATTADADVAAFQLDAVLLAANTSFRLGDSGVTRYVHEVVDGLLA